MRVDNVAGNGHGMALPARAHIAHWLATSFTHC